MIHEPLRLPRLTIFTQIGARLSHTDCQCNSSSQVLLTHSCRHTYKLTTYVFKIKKPTDQSSNTGYTTSRLLVASRSGEMGTILYYRFISTGSQRRSPDEDALRLDEKILHLLTEISSNHYEAHAGSRGSRC